MPAYATYDREKEIYARFYKYVLGDEQVEALVKALAKKFRVTIPEIKFRACGGSNYRRGYKGWAGRKGKRARISTHHWVSYGTAVHEFAHHLDAQRNNTASSHGTEFWRALVDCYAAVTEMERLNEQGQGCAVEFEWFRAPYDFPESAPMTCLDRRVTPCVSRAHRKRWPANADGTPAIARCYLCGAPNAIGKDGSYKCECGYEV